MGVRLSTRVRCRERKIRTISITRSEYELAKRLNVTLKEYCLQKSVRDRMVIRYKFGGKR